MPIVVLCTGGQPGMPAGCGFVRPANLQELNALAQDLHNMADEAFDHNLPTNCPTCGAQRVYERITRDQINRTNGN